jgi:predicted enzyme related to lactoylglutathione lyase
MQTKAKIRRIEQVTIPVADQDRALAFYTEKLGFEVHVDVAMGPQRWIELKIPGAETMLVLFTPEGHEDRVGTPVSFTLTCDDLEATHKKLQALGVTFEVPPTKAPWGYYCIIKDSEANTICLSEG